MFSLKNKFFAAIIFSVLLHSNAGAVFGGKKTSDLMRSSLVNIKMKNGMCSGVVVAPNAVVTAAHCTDLMGKAELVAMVAREGSTPTCDVSKVVDSVYSPGALPILPRNVHAPDLLMLRLETPLCSSKLALVQTTAPGVGDILKHTGYGAGNGSIYDTEEISLVVIEKEGAAALSTSVDKLFTRLLDLNDDYYIYALPIFENSTSCNGDSGGPVYVEKDNQMLLHAIHGAVYPNAELGAEKCNRGYLHLITPVAPYSDWIAEQINLWFEPGVLGSVLDLDDNLGPPQTF